IDLFGNRVAHRLHKAVDQRRLELYAGGRIDAAGGNEAVDLRLQETPLPVRAALLGLDLGERTRDAPAHLVDARFVAFGVLLEQRVPADLLRGRGSDSGVHYWKSIQYRSSRPKARYRGNYPARGAGCSCVSSASASASCRASFSRSATSACPMRRASSTGVSPSLVVIAGLASLRSRSSIIAGLPFMAA